MYYVVKINFDEDKLNEIIKEYGNVERFIKVAIESYLDAKVVTISEKKVVDDGNK